MARLPQPGGDEGEWGTILNEFLTVSHDTDGTVKADAVDASALQDGSVAGTKLQDNSVTSAKLSASGGSDGQVLTKNSGASGGIEWSATTSAPDATTTTKGIIQLAGDLGGTATAPTVPGLASKANTTTTVTAGTGLSGGGDLSANRTISANFGTTSGTITEGNDSRIAGAEQTANKGVANGYASLNGSALVPPNQLGSGSASFSTFLRGDRNWATVPVTSVAGKTGAVTLVEADIANLTTDLSERVTVTNGGGETYFDAGNSGTALTLNLTNGNVQKLTLTANCTITLTSPAAGAMRSLTLLVFQDATGSRTITWPGSVSWGNAGAPVLTTTAAKMDIVSLFTVDGGTTWYGALGAKGY